MQALIASLAIALSACAIAESESPFPTDIAWQWTTEEECMYPTVRHREALDRAAALWSEWGVDIHRAQGPDIDVLVCLTPGAPRFGYAGWTETHTGSPDRVWVNGIIAHSVAHAIHAHEMGHVVLSPHPAHHTGVGIMAPHVDILADWSQDDREFLAGAGLVWLGGSD